MNASRSCCGRCSSRAVCAGLPPRPKLGVAGPAERRRLGAGSGSRSVSPAGLEGCGRGDGSTPARVSGRGGTERGRPRWTAATQSAPNRRISARRSRCRSICGAGEGRDEGSESRKGVYGRAHVRSQAVPSPEACRGWRIGRQEVDSDVVHTHTEVAVTRSKHHW